jgi:hypothetical protein
MRRSNGHKRAQGSWLLPAITVACLASAGAAQACPSSSSYKSKRAAEERVAAAQAATDESMSASIDCPYSKRSRPMSTESKVALAAVPAALAAFAMGWRSGGRRRRANRPFDETTK